ncbi:MAG: response regulator [Candidatus Binataceae bacterium]
MVSDLKGLRVLLVEDEFFIAEELQLILEDAGMTVVGPAPSLHKALQIAQGDGGGIDVALLDVNLRGEHVYPLAQHLMARQVPFILMTGYSRDQLPSEYAARPVLLKPFNPDALLKLMGKLAR